MSVSFIDYVSLAKTRYTDLFKNDEAFDALIRTITTVLNDYQTENEYLFKNALNINTQKGYGLDFIGRLVKQSRLLTDFSQDIHFGFEGSYKSDTFGTITDPSVGGVFYSALSSSTGSGKLLTDVEYRNVIKARIISNSSKGNTNEFMKIANLLSFSTQNTVSFDEHGIINLSIIKDEYGLLSYFIGRIGTSDNILPIPMGYRLKQTYITE